jgi:LPXTG-motif cell wall-anchored protein
VALAFIAVDSPATTEDPCTPTTPPTTAPPGDDGSLPKTGTDLGGLVFLGVALLVSGVAVVLTVRRGRRAAT